MGPSTSAPSWRQHLQALLLAFVCAVLFLRDGLLPGRTVVPFPLELYDVPMAEALARGTFDPADACRGNISMADKLLQVLCRDRVMADSFRRGKLPLWTNDIGGGAPVVTQITQPYEPVSLMLFLLPSEQWLGWSYLLRQVLFGWTCYAFLRRLGCRHAAALVGLVAAVLGLWTQCKLHHVVLMTAGLPVWGMLSAVWDLVTGTRVGRAALGSVAWLGFWTGFSWCSGFPQVSLLASYLAGTFALFLAVHAERGQRLRRLLPVGLGFGLGALLALPNMVPMLVALASSTRDGAFAGARLAAEGLEWPHAFGLCWPDLLSWASDRFYPAGPGDFAVSTRMPWSQLVLLENPLRPVDGSPFQSWPETAFAVGLAPTALALLAWSGRGPRRAMAWFFGLVAVIAFGIATADQPFLGLARLLPGIAAADQRRAVCLVAMALVVLAAFGAEALLDGARRWPALVLLGLVATLSTLALLWLARHGDDQAFLRACVELRVPPEQVPAMTQAVENAAMPGEAAQNRDCLSVTAWRALLVAAAAGLALLWRRGVAVPVTIVLAIAELVHVGLGPVQTMPAERVLRVPAVLQPVADLESPNGDRPRLLRLAVRDQGQVSAAFPPNLPAFLGLEDAGGYVPLPPLRYEQFFAAIEPPRAGKTNVTYGGAGVGSFHDAASLSHALCDLYGIRFVVTRDDVAATPTLVDRTPPGTGGFRLLERTTTLPRATFVRTVDLLPDADPRLAALSLPQRDVANRIVLEDVTAPRPSGDGEARAVVRIVERHDERVVVQVRTDRDGYLRLADPTDPGWRARLDGAPTPLYVADHYLRAVFVPPGEHEVVFTYDAPIVVWPVRIGCLALLVCAALWFAARRRRP